jgi:transposase
VPWPDKQDEQLREAFLQKLEQLFNRRDVDIWFADESGFEGDPRRLYLPPYSPDLNPIERIWLTTKARGFNHYVCKNEEKLLERLDQAILDAINSPEKTQKTTAIGTLF